MPETTEDHLKLHVHAPTDQNCFSVHYAETSKQTEGLLFKSSMYIKIILNAQFLTLIKLKCMKKIGNTEKQFHLQRVD